MKLDHIAIALHRIDDVLATLVGELGARLLHGGESIGFRAVQVQVGDDGMSIELLEPHRPERSDFLARFLSASGEGPHHITFKTDDLRSAIGRAEDAGFHPVGVNLDSPFWKEAFLHPKEAGGTVIQLAESPFDPSQLGGDDSPIPGHGWWPEPPPQAAAHATLERVAVGTRSMPDALHLYRDLLGGSVEAEGEGVVDLTWSGGRVRLELTDREPGVDRLELVHDGGAAVRTLGGARFSLRPR